MKEAAIEFKEFLSTINFLKPIFPVVQNFEAIPYDDEEKIKEGLFHQLFNPVRWTQSMEFMSEKKLNIFLEIGPGKVLTASVRGIIEIQRIFQLIQWSQLKILKRLVNYTEEIRKK